MFAVIKILILLLVSFLTYDTINFLLDVSEADKLKSQQIEVRKEYETVEVVENPPPTKDSVDFDYSDDIIVLSLGLFVVVTGVCGIFAILAKYNRDKNGKLSSGNIPSNDSYTHDPAFNVRPMCSYYMENYEEEHSEYGADNPRLMRTYSNVQLATSPYIDLANMPEGIELPQVRKCTPEADGSRWLSKVQEIEDESKTENEEASGGLERAEFSEKNLNDNSVSIIDFNLLSINTSLSVQNTTRQDTTITQTDTAFMCECPVDKFEERLGAVEHGLKTGGEAQALWTKRIEQAEMDIISLHRQMYTILSKAEFVAPSSDIFSKTAGDSTPNDFYDPNIYKVPDVIIETKTKLEQGDLFKNSIGKNSFLDDLSEAEKKKIFTDKDSSAELKESARPKTRQISKSLDLDHAYLFSDQTKLKEELMKKNEEVKEKTKNLFKSMEEVLKGNELGPTLKKSKLSVHSHYVAPYRRIQNADQDHFNPSLYTHTQNNVNKLQSKVKIK